MDVFLGQVEKWLVQLNPFHVFPRGQAFALAAENIAAQAVIPSRQNNETKKPIQRAVRQNVGQKLAGMNKPMHQTAAIENGPCHDHPIDQLRSFNVDFLQNDTANAQTHEMGLADV